jgi:hypothetical protein
MPRINFTPGPDGLNIEPAPNPKPIHVERVELYQIVDGRRILTGVAFIRNANLDSHAHTARW